MSKKRTKKVKFRTSIIEGCFVIKIDSGKYRGNVLHIHNIGFKPTENEKTPVEFICNYSVLVGPLLQEEKKKIPNRFLGDLVLDAVEDLVYNQGYEFVENDGKIQIRETND